MRLRGKSLRPSLMAELVAKACGKALWRSLWRSLWQSLVADLVAKACGKSLWQRLWQSLVADLVAKACGKTLWRDLVAKSPSGEYPNKQTLLRQLFSRQPCFTRHPTRVDPTSQISIVVFLATTHTFYFLKISI